MRQIEFAMVNMDLHLVLEAKANLKKTWEDLFSLADVPDKDKELTYDELKDPNHPVTTLILYICQIQSFVFPEINRWEFNKIETLGPFDFALNMIIHASQVNRLDKEKYDC